MMHHQQRWVGRVRSSTRATRSATARPMRWRLLAPERPGQRGSHSGVTKPGEPIAVRCSRQPRQGCLEHGVRLPPAALLQQTQGFTCCRVVDCRPACPRSTSRSRPTRAAGARARSRGSPSAAVPARFTLRGVNPAQYAGCFSGCTNDRRADLQRDSHALSRRHGWPAADPGVGYEPVWKLGGRAWRRDRVRSWPKRWQAVAVQRSQKPTLDAGSDDRIGTARTGSRPFSVRSASHSKADRRPKGPAGQACTCCAMSGCSRR